MTAVIILVITLITFNIGSLKFMLVANKLVDGLPILKINVINIMGKRKKPTYLLLT